MNYVINRMSRHFKKWTVTELLALQREYELLGLNIYEIASRHKRSFQAILYKLEDEGMLRDYSKDMIEDVQKMNNTSQSSSDDNNTVTSELSERITFLESSIQDTMSIVNETKKMVQLLVNNSILKKDCKAKSIGAGC